MENQMIHHDAFVNPTSIAIILGTFLLDAVSTSPIIGTLTIISVCLGILYHLVKITGELVKAYKDYKASRKI